MFAHYRFILMILAVFVLKAQAAHPLWNSVTPPRSRDVLFSLPSYHTHFGKNTDHATLFFSRTSKTNKPFIDRASADGVTTLADQLANGTANAPTNAAVMKSVLHGLSSYEQRVGLIASSTRTLSTFWFWKFDLPIYLSTRAFNLHREDKKQLESAFNDVITTHPDPAHSITAHQLIEKLKKKSSKWGISDIRLQLGIRAPSSTSELVLGGECLIPVSSWFRSRRGHLPLGGKKLLTTTAGTVTELDTLIDQVRLVSIHPTLGNNGHWGSGGYFSLKIPLISKSLDLWNIIRYSHFFADNHYRMIMTRNSIPAEFKVRSTPGDITHVIHGIDWKIQGSKVSFGYDLFMQNQERLLSALDYGDVVTNELDPTTGHTPWILTADFLDLPLNQRSSLMQHKLFVAFAQTQEEKEYALSFACGGDLALTRGNIGKSFSLFIAFEARF